MVHIATFRAAEAAYKSITPIRGAQSADKDIRPLGQRRRKHERIVKISRNCYALTCGWHPGEEDWAQWLARCSYVPTLKDMAKYAPIVWRRHKDGTETITVRNGIGEGAHNGWYEFLRTYLPWSMRFVTKGGIQYIVANDVPHYLPKGRMVPKATFAGLPAHWRNRFQSTEDHAALTFKMQGGKAWGLVGGAQPAPKRRVNKALKAELKPHIDAFRDWAMAITPMLPRDPDYYRGVVHDANNYLRDQGHKGSAGSIYWAFGDRNFELARSIIADDEHPLRILLGLNMRYYIEKSGSSSSGPTTPSEFKAAYNNWANRVFNLIQKVEGETE